MWRFGERAFHIEIKGYLVFEMRGTISCSNRRRYSEGTRESVTENRPALPLLFLAYLRHLIVLIKSWMGNG